MAVSIDDIIKKEFPRSLMGYDMQEVDAFLDAIIDRIEKMEGERAELVAAMEKLLKRVERLEKSADGERRALDSGEKQPRKLSANGAAAAGPVHVQGGKANRDGGTDEKPDTTHAAKAHSTAKKHAGEALRTDAPAHSRPIRPAAQAFSGTSGSIETKTFAGEPASAALSAQETLQPDTFLHDNLTAAPAPSVAVEMETGAYAPDPGEIIPELLQDVENALLDGSIRPASHQDAPVRAADKTRVS